MKVVPLVSRCSTKQESYAHNQILVITNKIQGIRKEYLKLFRILIQSYGPMEGLERIDLFNQSSIESLKILHTCKINNRVKDNTKKQRIPIDDLFRALLIRVMFCFFFVFFLFFGVFVLFFV